jgi:hypothetical protein
MHCAASVPNLEWLLGQPADSVIEKRKECANWRKDSLAKLIRVLRLDSGKESKVGIFSYLDFGLEYLGEFALLD